MHKQRFAPPAYTPEDPWFMELIYSGRYQEAWDYFLVWSWARQMDTGSRKIAHKFATTGAQIENLLRYKDIRWHAGTVGTFIGNYLKLLSNRLWDMPRPLSDKDIRAVACALSRSKMECYLLEAAKEEARMRSKSKTQDRQLKRDNGKYYEYKTELNQQLTRVRRARNF